MQFEIDDVIEPAASRSVVTTTVTAVEDPSLQGKERSPEHRHFVTGASIASSGSICAGGSEAGAPLTSDLEKWHAFSSLT